MSAQVWVCASACNTSRLFSKFGSTGYTGWLVCVFFLLYPLDTLVFGAQLFRASTICPVLVHAVSNALKRTRGPSNRRLVLKTFWKLFRVFFDRFELKSYSSIVCVLCVEKKKQPSTARRLTDRATLWRIHLRAAQWVHSRWSVHVRMQIRILLIRQNHTVRRSGDRGLDTVLSRCAVYVIIAYHRCTAICIASHSCGHCVNLAFCWTIVTSGRGDMPVGVRAKPDARLIYKY